VSEKDIKSTNSKIVNIVGSQIDLMKLCIIDQKKSISFLNLSDIEKRTYLCDLLKLDVYSKIQKSLEGDIRVNNAEIKSKNDYIYVDPKNETGDKM